MAKSRRDPVADVLGDDSPIMSVLAKEAALRRPTDEQTGKSESRAVPPLRRSKPRQRSATKSSNITSTRVKRMIVSPEEEKTIDDLISKLNDQIDTKSQYSQISRAMWSLLLDVEEAMGRVPAPKLKRPSNGRPEEFAEFEAALSNYLLDLFQSVKPRPR